MIWKDIYQNIGDKYAHEKLLNVVTDWGHANCSRRIPAHGSWNGLQGYRALWVSCIAYGNLKQQQRKLQSCWKTTRQGLMCSMSKNEFIVQCSYSSVFICRNENTYKQMCVKVWLKNICVCVCIYMHIYIHSNKTQMLHK